MRKSFIILLISTIIFTGGCNRDLNSVQTFLNKNEASYTNSIPKLTELPQYDPNNCGLFQVDVRGKDLSQLDLSDETDNLVHGSFDTITKWPKKLPKEYKPKKIIKYGKNPGLGVKTIHKSGIKGENVGIAIIDGMLLKDHVEYKDNLKYYEEFHSFENSPSMHGAGVASIAVGETAGIAPNADLYYISTSWEDRDNRSGSVEMNFVWLSKAIDKILKVNETLEENKKIRVISLSIGVNPKEKGYEEFMDTVKRASDKNIFVVSSSLKDTYGFAYDGLGRDILSDPDEISSYKPNCYSEKLFFDDNDKFYNIRIKGLKDSEVLFIPMDSRTLASEAGKEEYVFYSQGGWSWCSPYIAGLYALTCQVKPDITPEVFWNTALETGDVLKIKKDDKEYEIKKIVNPKRLIDKLKKAN
ncbi:S8 family serine peptidase [Clostridium senegalense]|uniref:S8 family serine peptidase n=1 Tax=Clostridium senegalense TaxID=1465809 RepID=UPI001C108522|nr:S8 family serine peptidase [Clostridium senegalense]MBU5225282.1 S8 family serine peptidase [Clostridium senegalense]